MIGNISGPNLFIILVSLLISLVVHEYMHALTAHLLGDNTAEEGGRLSLNPLHHIDPFMTVILPIITLVLFQVPLLAAKPVPFNPDRVKYGEYGAALVALAGPVSNLIMAIIGAIILNNTEWAGFFNNALITFVTINVALFVFNILPIPPLDGSRVLYAFAPEPLQELMSSIEPFGLFIVFALVLSAHNFLVNLDQSVLNLLP